MRSAPGAPARPGRDVRSSALGRRSGESHATAGRGGSQSSRSRIGRDNRLRGSHPASTRPAPLWGKAPSDDPRPCCRPRGRPGGRRHAHRARPDRLVVTEFGVPVKMRDGVTLHADVYRPKDGRTYPVLLQRTPYNKDGDRELRPSRRRARLRGHHPGRARTLHVRGRVVPVQARVRRRVRHGGVGGRAAVCGWQGRMFGGSYVGATQMLAAIAHPPHLAGICPVVTASNYHSNWTYQGGAFSQWFNQSWTSGLAQDTIARNTRGRSNALKGMRQLPLGNFPLFNPPADGARPRRRRHSRRTILDWLAHPSEDGYWKQWSIEAHFSDISRAGAARSSRGTTCSRTARCRNYIGIKAHGANEAARNGQTPHRDRRRARGNGPSIGDVDFGAGVQVRRGRRDARRGTTTCSRARRTSSRASPSKLFVMGANQWRDEDDWPLCARARTKYFLHSAGQANSLAATARFRRRRPRRRPRINTSTIPRTRCRRSAVRSAATART